SFPSPTQFPLSSHCCGQATTTKHLITSPPKPAATTTSLTPSSLFLPFPFVPAPSPYHLQSQVAIPPPPSLYLSPSSHPALLPPPSLSPPLPPSLAPSPQPPPLNPPHCRLEPSAIVDHSCTSSSPPNDFA
ncbi:hypothetical protein Droror1_Dr00017595, partial [Drosera rotundifolia]